MAESTAVSIPAPSEQPLKHRRQGRGMKAERKQKKPED